MKIEQKLQYIGDWYRARAFIFCSVTFRQFFDLRNIDSNIFLVISHQKPTHNEYYSLRNSAGIWVLTDSYVHNNSPWLLMFDRFLSNEMGTDKPVYVWVEYEIT